MRALYEISQDILNCVDLETGEILDAEKLDALQMEREAKLEGVALWIKDMRAETAAIKEEADKLTARKKALDNKIESLKTWLMYALDGEKLNTPRCKVYQTHIQRVNVTDEEELLNYIYSTTSPGMYLRYKDPELNKEEIKKAMKDGYKFPGAELEDTESVVIK